MTIFKKCSWRVLSLVSLVIVSGIAFTMSTQAYAFPLTSRLRPNLNVLRSTTKSDFDFSGIVAFPGCSGVIVRWTNNPSAKAIAMTNGHCVGLINQGPTEVFYQKPYQALLSVYLDKKQRFNVRSTKIIYATMSLMDVAFLELESTYEELTKRGIKSYEIVTESATAGEPIALVSGYFGTAQQCSLWGTVYQLKEDQWTFVQSYKYKECVSIHGTSGSPLISMRTGKIIGINNTHNDNGEKCTMNNPCEVDKDGAVRVEYNMSYGSQLYPVHTCLNSKEELDLSVPRCKLPKPLKFRRSLFLRTGQRPN